MGPRPQVFEQCFRECYPRLVQFLDGMLDDRAAAEDAAQEAFFRLWSRGPTARPETDRWVFRVGRNLVLDWRKGALRRRRREAAYMLPDPNPEEDDDDIHRVRRIVHALPERAREVLLLREFTGLSYEEIARVVGRNTNTVKQDLHRARLALRRAWFTEEGATP